MPTKRKPNIQSKIIDNFNDIFLFPTNLDNHFHLMVPRFTYKSEENYFLHLELYVDFKKKILHIYTSGEPGYHIEGASNILNRSSDLIIEGICSKLNIDSPKENLVVLYFYDKSLYKTDHFIFGYITDKQQYGQVAISLDEEDIYEFFFNKKELLRDYFQFN
ncbi:hypothetical protein [Bacillus thuringiensis]|uniref:Uncharacterized protein n=1 Tax=Bacillus thuringiensis TaxID=1428 RepID=A0A9X6ZR09_BACTU|nr:hypothetical protein [Bacillus thuringiensis]PFJ33873.1 hypothetical protein COJ15_27390 [Bacillus thuringiensis]